MKTFIFDLSASLNELVFPVHRIKERKQLIELVIKCCRELTVATPLDTDNIILGNVAIVINKMSRMFFFKPGKYVSMALPISVVVNDTGNLSFQYQGNPIDSQMWSLLVTMLNTPREIVQGYEEYADYCCQADLNERILLDIFESFQQADYGYLRYEYDISGYTAAQNAGHPHRHPLYHYDIHLSNQATFKTGILSALKPKQFIEFVDNENDRWYVVPAEKVDSKSLKKR